MTDTPQTAADQLAELKARAAEAKERWSKLRVNLNARHFEKAREATADLLEYRDRIEAKKPDAVPVEDRPARERELTDQFLAAVKEQGLVVRVLGNGESVQLVDAQFEREFDESEAEMIAAGVAVQKFQKEHADDLEAERKTADAQEIKDALDSNDGDRIREALNPTSVQAAMTSNDLRSGVHRRHAVIGA